MPKRIISFFLGIATVVSMSFPALAADSSMSAATSGDIWAMALEKYSDSTSGFASMLLSALGGFVGGADIVCPTSSDNLHHGEPKGGQSFTGRGGSYSVICICDYCAEEFLCSVSSAQLSAAYDTYVQDLPAPGYDSSGGLRWRLNVPKFEPGVSSNDKIIAQRTGMVYSVSAQDAHNPEVSGACVYGLFEPFEAPIAGHYQLFASVSSSIGNGCLHRYGTSGNSFVFVFDLPSGGSSKYLPIGYADREVLKDCSYLFPGGVSFGVGETIFSNDSRFYMVFPASSVADVVTGYWELLCTPLDLSGDTYNINSRPASISGDYGIIGDDGKIIKVEGNSLSIVNETNNTYYNPATGQTSPVTDWTYDYPSRTYNLTLDTGDKATVTYGDENLTITEGDTVYNVYYLAEDSGEAPADCSHEWSKTSTTAAACTVPGSVTYTCSLCSQTKTETVPASGHTWQVKQTVTTQYDESGNLVTQGYTIYECSVCHEQYKDDGGAGPPSSPGSDDPGKPSTIGGLIEKLLSGVGGVVGGLIKGVLSLLTKAVEALAGIGELFAKFTESVVTIFGGFTSFLSAVFPFLPEEFFTIFTLGTILLVAAAVLKKFLS